MQLSLSAFVAGGPVFSKPKADGDGGPSLKGFNGAYQIAGFGGTGILGAALKKQLLNLLTAQLTMLLLIIIVNGNLIKRNIGLRNLFFPVIKLRKATC